jgi:DNA-binding NtrC family response regulator
MMRSLDDAVKNFVRGYIVEALARNRYHMGRAAEELCIHRNTLTRRCREVGIVTGRKSPVRAAGQKEKQVA